MLQAQPRIEQAPIRFVYARKVRIRTGGRPIGVSGLGQLMIFFFELFGIKPGASWLLQEGEVIDKMRQED